MSDLGKNLDEQTYHARADRRFTQGQVIAVDGVSYTCTVDVGAVDVTGVAVYLHDVPYQAQTPPSVGDTVALVYANASPQSVSVSGTARGGPNAGSAPTVANTVTSLATVGGGAALQGAVLVAGAGAVGVSQAGQTITITGAGIFAESGGSSPVGPESVLNFIAGSDISSITVTDNTGVTPHRIDVTVNASGGSGGVNSLNSLMGALAVTAGAGIGVSASGSSIEVSNTAAVEVVQRDNGVTGTAMGSNLLHVILTGSTTTYVMDPSAAQSWQVFNGTSGEVVISCASGSAFANTGSTVSMPPNEYALFVAIDTGSSYNVYLLNSGLRVVSLSSTSTLTPAQVYNAALHVDATAGAVTITLPDAAQVAAAKFPFSLKKIDASANAVMVQGGSGQTIDGAASRSLTSQYQDMTLYSDGSHYFVR